MTYPTAPAREELAKIIALAGLGTTAGQDRKTPPNDRWEQGEWVRQLLECVPTEVERRCYELADAILARFPLLQRHAATPIDATDARAAALEIAANVRSGRTDPRSAAQALGLPFDQDIIMGIISLAAAAPPPLDAGVRDMTTAEFLAALEKLTPEQYDAMIAGNARRLKGLGITEGWFRRKAALEGDLEVGAGAISPTILVDAGVRERVERVANRLEKYPEPDDTLRVERTFNDAASGEEYTRQDTVLTVSPLGCMKKCAADLRALLSATEQWFARVAPADKAGPRMGLSEEDAVRQPSEVLAALRARGRQQCVVVFRDGSHAFVGTPDVPVAETEADFLVAIPLPGAATEQQSGEGEADGWQEMAAVSDAIEKIDARARAEIRAEADADAASRAQDIYIGEQMKARALGEEVQRLREALEGFADDYMTSETHHPGYVLIPTEKFERIRTALSPSSEGGA